MRFAVLVTYAYSKAIVGTNIGGWMVLEPWITPSLFYRFLGNTKDQGVGMDSYTFCEALGPEEGNRVMRSHWDNWVTEAHIKGLADREVEVVRLPIGDWTTTPYGPYIGCMDGAAEKIEWFLDTAAKYGLKVLLDVHALKDSQNGFDNSGQALDLEWVD
jgi:glucan 1,3-beta-glucosidase